MRNYSAGLVNLLWCWAVTIAFLFLAKRLWGRRTGDNPLIMNPIVATWVIVLILASAGMLLSLVFIDLQAKINCVNGQLI